MHESGDKREIKAEQGDKPEQSKPKNYNWVLKDFSISYALSTMLCYAMLLPVIKLLPNSRAIFILTFSVAAVLLIVAAVNDGARKAAELGKSEMFKLTGGLNIPGMF